MTIAFLTESKTIGEVLSFMTRRSNASTDNGAFASMRRANRRMLARITYRKISRASRLQMVSNTPYVSNTVDAIKARRIAAVEAQVMAEIEAMSNADGTLISQDSAEAKRLHKNELARARTAARNASKKV